MIKVLKDNNYPLRFIQSCKSHRDTAKHEPYNNDTSTTNKTPTSNTFVVLPYVRGASEKLSRVLRNNGLKVGYKPLNVLRARFPRPKDKSSAAQTKGVVDKIVCSDYGQTDRALQTRIKNTKGQFAFGTVTQKWLFELRAFAMSRVFCETLSHARKAKDSRPKRLLKSLKNDV